MFFFGFPTFVQESKNKMLNVCNRRIMAIRHGHQFYFSPKLMPASSQDDAIFIKYGMTEFSSFLTHEHFYKWFGEYHECCRQSKHAFKIFELVMHGRPTAFYADIDGYSPVDTSEDELLMIRHTLKDVFRTKYALLGGEADKLIWMEDHRESGGLQKTSFHVVGRDKKFTDVKNNGSMRIFADRLNSMVTPEVVAQGLNIRLWDKTKNKDSVMDMHVYHSKRPLRTLYSSKYSNARGFVLCEECRYRDFRDCFINLNIPPEDFHKHHFIMLSKEAPSTTGTTTTRRLPLDRQVVHQEATSEQEATMRRIEHVLSTDYNHRLTAIKYTGVYKRMDQYRIDGIRECPVCGIVHDSNGAYVRDLENGQFEYQCLTAGPNNKGLGCIASTEKTRQEKPVQSHYLQSLLGIMQVCVAVCAGMGVGKTHQIVEYIRSLQQGESVLWLTPRIAMVASTMGRLSGLGFKSYKQSCAYSRLVMEIESLHKVFMQYDVIIMDEARSLMTSLMSYETNGDYLLEHVNDLKEMCQSAKRVFVVGADISIDGAVPAFIRNVFEEDQVFRVNHTSTLTPWHHVFVHTEAFYERLYRSIDQGERIIVACGASADLKEIQVAASRIIERKKMVASRPNSPADEIEVAVSMIQKSDAVGAYHAECEIKHELEDVSTYWNRYQVILYTSTITVSVDYQGEIDRVYSMPSICTANDREEDQMTHRARKNKSMEVVVRYDGPCITPRANDDDVLFNEEMSRVTTKRKYVKKIMRGYEREINKSIEKKGFGYQAKYSPTLATELHAWAMVEEYKKINDWYGSYLARLKAKGRTWEFAAIKPSEPVQTPIDLEVCTLEGTRKEILRREESRVRCAKQIRREIKSLPMQQRKEARALLKRDKDGLEQELAACRSQLTLKKSERDEKKRERPPTYTEQAKKRKKDIKEREVGALGKADTLNESPMSLKTRKHRKFDGKATANDHVVLKKDEAQRYFPESLSGEEVAFFLKNKRAIFNRALYAKYPRAVRHKLHANSIEMSIADDYVNMDIKLLDLIDGIIGELGLDSVADTMPFDWEAMQMGGESEKVKAILNAMDDARGVSHSCSSDLARMRHYFKTVLGYKILTCVTKTRHGGTRTSYSTYYLADGLGDILERPNTIVGTKWLTDQCSRYNEFVMTTRHVEHDEAAFIRAHMEQI